MINFRETIDTNEIRNLLKLLLSDHHPINIWQTQFQQRQMTEAEILTLERDHIMVKLSETLDLIPEKHIYFYSEFKKIVFKVNYYSLKENLLKITIPKEITLEELRSEKRFNLSHVKNTVIEFEKNDTLEKSFSARLYDLSTNGISFLVPAKNKDLFVLEDKVKLQKIAKDVINLNGKVMHIMPFTSKAELVKVPLYKIGVKLDMNLDLDSLHVFRQLLQQ